MMSRFNVDLGYLSSGLNLPVRQGRLGAAEGAGVPDRSGFRVLAAAAVLVAVGPVGRIPDPHAGPLDQTGQSPGAGGELATDGRPLRSLSRHADRQSVHDGEVRAEPLPQGLQGLPAEGDEDRLLQRPVETGHGDPGARHGLHRLDRRRVPGAESGHAHPGNSHVRPAAERSGPAVLLRPVDRHQRSGPQAVGRASTASKAALAAADRIFPLLDRQPKIVDPAASAARASAPSAAWCSTTSTSTTRRISPCCATSS